jgi:hypothetical protein
MEKGGESVDNLENKAAVETLKVSINALRIGSRQVTRNILDQIPESSILITCKDSIYRTVDYNCQYLGWVKDIKHYNKVFLIFVDGYNHLCKEIIYRAWSNQYSDYYWINERYFELVDGIACVEMLSNFDEQKMKSDDSTYADLTGESQHLYIQA